MEATDYKKTEEDLIYGYLKGELTPGEIRDLIDWIKLDRANKQIFDECCELWITLRAASKNNDYNLQEGFWKFRQRIRSSDNPAPLSTTGNRFLRTAFRYAAIFIVAFLAGGLLFHQSGSKPHPLPHQGINEIVVPLGSRASYKLADGTMVTLNAGSTLRTGSSYGSQDRIVELEGEGYFRVTKDSLRPFMVKTSHLTVVALGTEFNLKAYSVDRTIETTLVNGSIKVEPNSEISTGEITILQPNQMLTFYKEHAGEAEKSSGTAGESKAGIKLEKVQARPYVARLVKEDVNIEPVVSWKENQWIFENQSLSQIAVILERRFDVQILFSSERLKSYRFTGIILAEPIEQVLEVMGITAPISFNLNGRVVTFSENKDFIKANKNLYTQPEN